MMELGAASQSDHQMINAQIIHDLDRDGWGSAALLVAELGADRCRLYAIRTKDKDVRPVIAELATDTGDQVWVLDHPPGLDVRPWRTTG